MAGKVLYQSTHPCIAQALSLARRIRIQAQTDAEKKVIEAEERIKLLEEQHIKKFNKNTTVRNLILLERLRHKQIERNKESIIAIATLVAKECLLAEFECRPEIALPRIKNAVSSILSNDYIRIKAAQESIPMIRQALGADLELIPCRHCGPFDFTLETPLGTIEGKLDEQIASMKKALEENIELVFLRDIAITG